MGWPTSLPIPKPDERSRFVVNPGTLSPNGYRYYMDINACPTTGNVMVKGWRVKVHADEAGLEIEGTPEGIDTSRNITCPVTKEKVIEALNTVWFYTTSAFSKECNTIGASLAAIEAALTELCGGKEDVS